MESLESLKTRFTCTKCGNCCNKTGWVLFSESEIIKAAEGLGISYEEFMQSFKDLKYEVHSDKESDFDDIYAFMMEDRCVFYLEYEEYGGCSIYPYRPAQCRTFPFWNEEIFEQSKEICDGARACVEE